MTTTLSALSNDLAALVERAAPHIVQVDARKRLPATGIVWSADGVIVTAAHVITRREHIHVGLPDGNSAPATLAGYDVHSDLAVLRVDGVELSPAAWITSDDLHVGELVLALGRPGSRVQATLGVISALADHWRTPAGARLEHYVQTDVVMYPGFSGGPLMTASGAFAGLNTSAILGGGVSITIHAATLQRVVRAILEHGGVRRGYLGIGTQPVRLPDDLARELGQETALLVVSVEPGSPAAEGGLLLGDTIAALDGERIRHIDDLQAALSGERVGQAVKVQIVRGGQIEDRTVTVGERH